MGLDIRYPIGLMFSLIGALMTVYGLATGGSEVYQRSLGANINLFWGVLLLAFGLWMLWMANKAGKAGKPPGGK